MPQRPKKLLDQVRDAMQLKQSVGLAGLPGGPCAQGAAEAEAEVEAAHDGGARNGSEHR